MESSFNKRMASGKKVSRYSRNADAFSPLVSIITVVRNAGNYLDRVIKDVQSQTYVDKEYIIIDGGSTDGTLEVLKKYDDKIDFWVSEQDQGIYDAMNKGIDVAEGEWIYFLGADDTFYSTDTLEKTFKNRIISGDVNVLLGDVICGDGNLFRSRFGRSMYFKNTVHHQGVFYRRSVFERFRYGKTLSSGRTRQYSISGDYELNLLLFLQGARHIHVNEVIAKCEDGISMQGNTRGYVEEILIRHEHIGFLKAIFFDAITLLRYLFKKATMTVGI